MTSCDGDLEAIIHQAAHLLSASITASEKGWPNREPQHFLMRPHLRRLGSTSVAPGVDPKSISLPRHASQHPAALSALARWPDTLEKRQALAAEINSARFASDSDNADFRPIDVTAHANRSLHRQNSWLGLEPLLHFPPRMRVIHGVPFHIINETKNDGNGVIVLRSLRAHTSHGQQLPTQVEIPVGQKVLAVHILHAAGWVMPDRAQAFAEYGFVFSKEIDRVPVQGFGRGAEGEPLTADSIIQDWHPSYPQMATKSALPFAITANDPLDYARFLYNYQWINPFPARKLKSILIRSLLPNAQTTLGILAVTLKIGSS